MENVKIKDLISAMAVDIKKIAARFNLDRAELENELWLFAATRQTMPSQKDAGRHLVSRAIQLSRCNGVCTTNAVALDDTETVADLFAATELDPLSVMLATEAEIERDQRIDALDSLTKARLSAAECARSAAEMGRKLGLKGRKARHALTAWVDEAAQVAQPQLF